MKKLSFLILISTGLALSACHNNNSPAQTGNAQTDSGSAGSSGASDTTKAVQGSSIGAGASASGNPTSSGSDTSTTSH